MILSIILILKIWYLDIGRQIKNLLALLCNRTLCDSMLLSKILNSLADVVHRTAIIPRQLLANQRLANTLNKLHLPCDPITGRSPLAFGMGN